MDLFSSLENKKSQTPLAARMRPKSIDDFIGQDHIIGHGRLLRRSIQADKLSSVIFYGPPGTGKTTLAKIIACTTEANFIALNAVLSGVKELREAIAEAKEKRDLYKQRSILFVDEVHRWNKAQQDALLPWVENGTIIFIGATTENPYFEVIKPLVSRSRIFQLKSLKNEDLYEVMERAVNNRDHGYGKYEIEIKDDAKKHLVDVCNGDARTLLNALELAVETTSPNEDGLIIIDLEVAQESIQQKAVLYDKEGDIHYDTISAFIKSLRGSDPDASLYWMAKMIYAGEDPRFIFRRMIIFAGEDIGLADPNAINVVMSCSQAYDYVGMPEGRFHLAEAVLYLATAPKSNSTMAFFDALNVVKKESEAEVPNHLKDANRDSESFGHGANYLYPHAYRDHWVAQQYLPKALQGRVFFKPSNQGYEKQIQEKVESKRETQLASILEEDVIATPEILTFSGIKVSGRKEQWLSRTISQTGEMLGNIRDKVLKMANIQRYHTVFDINAKTGVLTWSALRAATEGGVWALAHQTKEAEMLTQQSSRLEDTDRPVIIHGKIDELESLFEKKIGKVRFDAIIGRNFFTQLQERKGITKIILSYLTKDGVVAFAQSVPKYTQRLYNLIEKKKLTGFFGKLKKAEEKIYSNKEDVMLNWSESDIEKLLFSCDLKNLSIEKEENSAEVCITPGFIQQWFSQGSQNRKSYKVHLQSHGIDENDLKKIEEIYRKELLGKVIQWTSVNLFIKGKRK